MAAINAQRPVDPDRVVAAINAQRPVELNPVVSVINAQHPVDLSNYATKIDVRPVRADCRKLRKRWIISRGHIQQMRQLNRARLSCHSYRTTRNARHPKPWKFAAAQGLRSPQKVCKERISNFRRFDVAGLVQHYTPDPKIQTFERTDPLVQRLLLGSNEESSPLAGPHYVPARYETAAILEVEAAGMHGAL